MNTSESKVKSLRKLMRQHGIDLYVMQNNDPHESEYLPDHWKEIEWLCGFRGEVATVIITQQEALLWTDSRFFISGAQQLADTPLQLMKMKVAGVPTVDEWLDDYRAQADVNCLGGDQRILFGIEVDVDINLIDLLWDDRPSLPTAPIEVYSAEYSGEETTVRIDRVLSQLEEQGTKGLWLKTLDDIAWTLNLRGSDIECTPIFTAYLWLSREEKLLFTDPVKVTPEVRDHLKAAGVELRTYEEAPAYRTRIINKGIDPEGYNPIPLMKAQKNAVEIAGYREAMLRDGIALTRFYHWLEQELQAGHTVTEMQCSGQLIAMRREQPRYREESFPAIVAWNEHAAMPHYEPSAQHDTPITGNGLLLIDTGGQYLDGTTDITRTIGIGQVSPEMKRDYTLVLKGHIRLAQAVFPRGTRGDQLDALARIDLWREGKTYRHGTSHGVGHYLSVHEGPESVRMEHNPQQLLDGMLFSNEPAIYLGGKYGIRHENCVLVRPFDVEHEAPLATPCDREEQGDFQCLETLTLCYIDTQCVDPSIMNREETEWLNNYNQWVYDTVAPHLKDDDRNWLKGKTLAI